MNGQVRAKGTINEPTLIPSVNEKRIVGCVCKCHAINKKPDFWM